MLAITGKEEAAGSNVQQPCKLNLGLCVPTHWARDSVEMLDFLHLLEGGGLEPRAPPAPDKLTLGRLRSRL